MNKVQKKYHARLQAIRKRKEFRCTECGHRKQENEHQPRIFEEGSQQKKVCQSCVQQRLVDAGTFQNILGTQRPPDPFCTECGGTGEVWKYYKEESQNLIHQPYALCPQCFPELHIPIVEMEGWVEISCLEANRLEKSEGYTWE